MSGPVAYAGPVHRWDLFWADLDYAVGSEQGGARRPVLVLSNDGVNASLPVVTQVPLTKLEKIGALTDPGLQTEIENRLLEHLGIAFEVEDL